MMTIAEFSCGMKRATELLNHYPRKVHAKLHKWFAMRLVCRCNGGMVESERKKNERVFCGLCGTAKEAEEGGCNVSKART